MKTSAILLAGGQGSRMKSTTAKQFLQLKEKPLILYSYETLMATPEINEVIVVCDPEFRHLFGSHGTKPVVFALPGARRQDSVYNGLLATSADAQYICVHDGARPFMTQDMVVRTLEAAKSIGAATVGIPVRFTVKEVDAERHVKSTPDRKCIWEIQTPQIVSKEILTKGFAHAHRHDITVTDDVSLAELVGSQVKLVEGSSDNIKITVPSDLIFAHQLLESHA